MLELIVEKLKPMPDARAFHDYLDEYIFREENGDDYNDFGGIIRNGESILFNFDLRTFAPKNRTLFWRATRQVHRDLLMGEIHGNAVLIELFTDLLAMHDRIQVGEDPMELNDLSVIEPVSGGKLGPGW